MPIRAIVLLGIGWLLSVFSAASAQDVSAYPVVLQKITSDLVEPQTLGSTNTNSYTQVSGNGPTSRSTKWLRVEFQYDVNPKNGDYLDEITFHIWIEGRDLNDPRSTGQGVPVGFSGTVTYVNIYKGKNGFGVVYLHPSTLDRYKGPQPENRDYLHNFDVHVEASTGGVLICTLNKNANEADANWFRQLKPVSGLVMTKRESPFALVDLDRYPAEKLRTPSAE